MKHKFADDATVNLTVKLPTEDLDHLVDKVVDGAVTIIAVFTAAHIFRKWVAP